MEELSKLTIILTPHNRQSYLNRILKFYKGLPMRIIVADSSISSYTEKDNLGPRVSYLFLKNANYYDKVNEALKLVKTEYTLIHAEDDYYVPQALAESISFLNVHKDYVSCQGTFWKFKVKPARIEKSLSYYHSYDKDLDQDTSLNRAEALFASYFQFFYAIHRSSSLRSIFSFFKPEYSNLFIVEVTIAAISLTHGKHRVLPNFYAARESLLASAGKSKNNFSAFVSDHPEIFSSYVRDLAVLYAEADGSRTETVYTQLELILRTFADREKSAISLKRKVQKTKVSLQFHAANKSFNRQWGIIEENILAYPV